MHTYNFTCVHVFVCAVCYKPYLTSHRDSLTIDESVFDML